MKKFLLIFGAFVMFLICTATMFKLMHWPGAAPLLVLGDVLFCWGFLPVFFIERMIANKSTLNIITNIFALLTTNMTFMGVLFKLMHWPGAGPMIVLGTALFIFPTMILYVIQQFKEYDRKFREFWRVVVMSILVSVFLIFWGSNVTRGILSGFVNVEDVTLETNKNLTEFNAYLLQEIRTKSDSSKGYAQTAMVIAEQSTAMVQSIEDIKKQMIGAIELNPAAQEDHWMINSKDNADVPTHFLCTPGGPGQQLFEKLNLFKQKLTEEMQELPLENKEAAMQQLGDFGIKTELRRENMEETGNWQEGMFYQQTMVGSLAILSGIQNQILNAEFKSLKTIKMNCK